MDMEDKETAPGTVLLAVDVARRQAELRRRSVIMTEDPVEAAEWLRTYRHPMTELISIGPWASYSAFNQGAGVDLPRLLLSDRVRSACAEEVAGLDYAAQQAKYLFSYEDAAEWIEANVETRVMSVVVPLSIFATDPDALRAEFEEEKRLRFTNVKTKEGAAKPRRILARWNVVKNLAKEAREAISIKHSILRIGPARGSACNCAMDMEDKETAPGTVLLAVDVARRQAELRRRSVIMTEDPVEAAEWLRTYRHPMTELISIGPWASYSAFNQGAGVDLPRLLLSDRVRSACAEEVAGLDYAAQQAKYLFSYEDAAEWIEANVETRVMSVVVPLSIFATDPDALRAEFEEEKRLRFTNVKTKEGAAKPRRILARWNVVKNLAKEAREAIGNWSSDYAAEKVRQQVAWPVPPSMEVDFPGCVFARYRTSAEIEPTRQRTHNTILFTGMAVHREIGRNRPYCRRHFTPGLLLGGPRNWPDYEIGLVDVMSIPRAAALLGESFIRHAAWRLSPEDVVWCGDASVLHDVKLSSDMRILLGLSRERRRPVV